MVDDRLEIKTGCWTVCLLLLGVSSNGVAQDTLSFRFLATGDTPYSQRQEEEYRSLLAQARHEDFAFLMHVGDFKAGRAPCSDEAFQKIRDLFRDYPTPVVYTPGDNEWTDCHMTSTDPRERLSKVREMFFVDDTVLRLSQLHTVHQGNGDDNRFVENYRFVKGDVLFVVVNVCGSKNNRRLGVPDAMREYQERTAANLAFLRDGLRQALTEEVAGLAIVIHANPQFEQGSEPGFHQVLTAFREILSAYKKPVLCIHGDSHYFRIDKPLKDRKGTTYMHFTRLEVFGSPNVAGVVVTVDPSDPQVFSYRPYP